MSTQSLPGSRSYSTYDMGVPQHWPYLQHQTSIWWPNSNKNLLLQFLDELPVRITSILHRQYWYYNTPWSWARYHLASSEPSAQLEYCSTFPRIPAHCYKLWISHQNKDDRTRHVQTTSAYLWSKFHFVRCYHPIPQFYSKTTWCGEVSQNIREEVPFQMAIRKVVKAPLKWHDYCHDTTSILICARWVKSDAE